MKPLTSALAFLAILGAVATILFVVLGQAAPEPVEIEEALPARTGPAPLPTRRMELPKGGVYAGRVLDQDGRPVPGASILLVAYDTGDGPQGTRGPSVDPADFDWSQVPVVGFRTAARTVADPGGRFRVAADPDSAIRIVFAWHVGYVPRLVGVDGPTEGLEIVLAPAGKLVGHVVDAETGRPVAYANVAIYLQQRTAAVIGGVGSTVRERPAPRQPSFFATAQRWVAEELGPSVWGATWEGDESIRVWTDEDGDFTFGPVGDEVQLEFVITHADYMWTEHDRTAHETVERTVIRPGETVERTFRMQKGKSISGRVLDERNRGVPDVLVSVDHVAQYTQHWWYRVKPRRARTRRDGSFKVGGLSFGPYTVTLQHPASGRTDIPGIPDGATNLELEVRNRGAIQGTVRGLEKRPSGERATLVLEAVGEAADGARHVTEQVTLQGDPEPRFMLRGVRPGRWSAWLQVGGMSSQPQVIEVVGLATADVEFELGGGGGLSLRVWEAGNREVDPATVHLISLDAEGAQRRLGQFVTRGGALDAEGIVPGRYVAEVGAAGYLTAQTEPFEVVADGHTDVGDVFLQRPAVLRIRDIQDAAGRPATAAVYLSLREGDGPFRALTLMQKTEVPVKPGLVTVRARSDDGTEFEETYEVVDGADVDVIVRLRRP
jgi:hypothetical protein